MKISHLSLFSLFAVCLIGCSNMFSSNSSQTSRPAPIYEESNIYTTGQGIVADSFDLLMKKSQSSGSSTKKSIRYAKNDDNNQNFIVLFKNCNEILGETYAVLENLYQRKINNIDINNTKIHYEKQNGNNPTLYPYDLSVKIYEEENLILITSDYRPIYTICYDDSNENALFLITSINQGNYVIEMGDKDNYSYVTGNSSEFTNLINTEYSSFKDKNIVEKIEAFSQNYDTRTDYSLEKSVVDNYYDINNLHTIFFMKHYYQLVETINDGDVAHVEMNEKTGVTKFQTNPMMGSVYDPSIEDYRDGVVGEFEYSYGEAPEGTRIVSEVASCYKTIYLPYTIEEVTCELPNVELVFVETDNEDIINNIKSKGSENMKVLKYGEFVDHHGLYAELVPQN